jgi:hypothetical protein
MYVKTLTFLTMGNLKDPGSAFTPVGWKDFP